MLGAVIGDVIGSVHEYIGTKTKDFPLFTASTSFTDDSVLTAAVAYAILNKVDYAITVKSFGRRYPGMGYGGYFNDWLHSDSLTPYNSWANGSAMRVSPEVRRRVGPSSSAAGGSTASGTRRRPDQASDVG